MITNKQPIGWPDNGLVGGGRLLVDSGDERVWAGLATATRLGTVVSMRDLGAGADVWTSRLGRLGALSCPAVAPLVDASIVADRFVVVSTLADGPTVHARLAAGPLDGAETVALALAALAATEALHARGVSAAGLRLAAATLAPGPEGGAPRVSITSYGLHPERDVDVARELRELALRLLSLAGATLVDGRMSLPAHALSPVVNELLHEAAGLVPGHPLAGAARLAAALRVATHRYTRPMPAKKSA